MTNQQLREWQSRINFTNADAAEALGMSLSGYRQQRQGVHRTRGTELVIDRLTDLACLALEMLAERAKTGRLT